jgi:hypothetical protein
MKLVASSLYQDWRLRVTRGSCTRQLEKGGEIILKNALLNLDWTPNERDEQAIQLFACDFFSFLTDQGIPVKAVCLDTAFVPENVWLKVTDDFNTTMCPALEIEPIDWSKAIGAVFYVPSKSSTIPGNILRMDMHDKRRKELSAEEFFSYLWICPGRIGELAVDKKTELTKLVYLALAAGYFHLAELQKTEKEGAHAICLEDESQPVIRKFFQTRSTKDFDTLYVAPHAQHQKPKLKRVLPRQHLDRFFNDIQRFLANELGLGMLTIGLAFANDLQWPPLVELYKKSKLSLGLDWTKAMGAVVLNPPRALRPAMLPEGYFGQEFEADATIFSKKNVDPYYLLTAGCYHALKLASTDLIEGTKPIYPDDQRVLEFLQSFRNRMTPEEFAARYEAPTRTSQTTRSDKERFERFVQDFQRYALDKLGYDVEPLNTDVIMVADLIEWRRLERVLRSATTVMTSFAPDGDISKVDGGPRDVGGLPNWCDAKGAAVYLPTVPAPKNRLNLLNEILKEHHKDHSEQHEALALIRKPSTENAEATKGLYFTLAAASIALLQAAHNLQFTTIIPIFRFHQKKIRSMVREFQNTQSAEESTQHYTPSP